MDDNFLITKVLEGNVEAFSILVERYRKMVMSICFRIVENYHEAEELSQDVFMKAFNSLSTHKRDAKFSNWLYRIAYTTSISRTRKFKIRTEEIDTKNNPGMIEINQGLENLETTERNRIIDHALNQLKPAEKLLVTMYYFGECSVDDISGITRLSPANVKVRIFRIRKKLFEVLKFSADELINKD